MPQTEQTKHFKREQPQHTLTIAGYYIGKYPVTVGEHRVFWEQDGIIAAAVGGGAGDQRRLMVLAWIASTGGC